MLSLRAFLQRIHIDGFLLALVLTVLTASFFPCTGSVQIFFNHLTTAAIALLFFMHGAKLSREAIMLGVGHWRLHVLVMCSTFILFPLLGLALGFLPAGLLDRELYLGFLFLCALPATVQSAIAFTSIAKGNIAAAVCSASASSILGVFVSPILVGLLISTQSTSSAAENANGGTLEAIGGIMLQLLVPFILGHLMRPLIVKWLEKHRNIIKKTDSSSILLVVYTAFSEAVVQGIWSKVSGWDLFSVVIISCVLLAAVIVINTYMARRLGFNKADEITIVFCGSKKSLANGVPMANVLFPAASVGIMILPLMIFHQIQLMVCAALASRYARRDAL